MPRPPNLPHDDIVQLNVFPKGTEFSVESDSRTIRCLALPAGATADNGFAKWRFDAGAVQPPDPITRVKVLKDHNRNHAIGYAAKYTEDDNGLHAKLQLARTQDAAEVLTLVEDHVYDGVSIGIRFTPDPDDPDDFGVEFDEDTETYVVHRATLFEISLTPFPAFDDARVEMTRKPTPPKESDLTRTAPQPTTDTQPAPQPTTDTQPADVGLAGVTAAVEAFTDALGNMTDQITTVLQAPQGPPSAPTPGAGLRLEVGNSAPTYTFDGRGPSLVLDTHRAKTDPRKHPEAVARLERYARETEELTRHVHNSQAQFAHTGVDETTGANVVPPGYRPDLFVGQLMYNRPIFNAMSRGSIGSATPFTVPRFGSATGMVDTHVDGERPVEGTVTLGQMTVTPSGESGKMPISRGILDAANPGIDAIVFGALRDGYAQKTEGILATLLETAAGTDTNGDGISDAGIYLVEVSGTGAQLVYGLRSERSKYPFRRLAPASTLILASDGYTAVVDARDTTGRPLVPYAAGDSGYGTVTAGTDTLNLEGLHGVGAWALDSAEQDAYLWAQGDVWAWESPVLEFRYEEKHGPEQIELALFGYFAAAILRPSGVTAVGYTAES